MNKNIQVHLYSFTNNAFNQIAIIDDVQDLSFEHNYFSAGQFTISINNRIPDAKLFERGLFVQIGNNPYMFGEIGSIQDTVSNNGTHIRNIIGFDARYLLKRRIIKNMNNNGKWSMTGKGEEIIRSLINDQCGSNAEEKRRLPIVNEESLNPLGRKTSVTEEYSNLYEIIRAVATECEIGWRIKFDGGLTLEIFKGEDKSEFIKFSPSWDSLSDGNYKDDATNYCNTVYVGGKGQDSLRDIYEGEQILDEINLLLKTGEDGVLLLNDGGDKLVLDGILPIGLNRFEVWDNQSEMVTEEEYKNEAFSILAKNCQTIEMTGTALIKCPFTFLEDYNIGDFVTIEFSDKKAVVQILSVTERWQKGVYTLGFTWGKPVDNFSDQMQIILQKIQQSSNKQTVIDSVKWYNVEEAEEQDKSDTTFNTLGFTGDTESGKTFTLFLNSEGVGSKRYNIYCKNLSGSGLTLSTSVAGSSTVLLEAGSYVTMIFIDTDGNILKVV